MEHIYFEAEKLAVALLLLLIFLFFIKRSMFVVLEKCYWGRGILILQAFDWLESPKVQDESSVFLIMFLVDEE